MNDKDNSRRFLFEEAAGISKFKIRKKETLRKLKDTDDDLDRVEDLLFEIEKNLKSLERQARQAKRYYEIKEEYKSSSIALAQTTISSQNEVLHNIERQIQQENDKKSSLNTQLSEKEANLERLKIELLNREKLLSTRQKTLNEHVNKIRQYESEKKIKNERQRFLQDRIDKLKAEISSDKQSNERAAFSIESLDKEKVKVQEILSEINIRLEKLKDEYEYQKEQSSAFQKEVNEQQQQYQSKREAVYQYAKELEIKHIQLSSLKIELEKTTESSSEHSANLEEFDSKLKELETKKTEKQVAFDTLKKYQEDLNTKKQEQQEVIANFKDELASLNRKIDAKQNEFNLTKSLVDNLEGFPEAIKFLKKQSKFKNAPLLSDIISCPEEYRICIENFLEPFMNYYIVNTEDEAKEAISLLYDSSRGKANFFILDQLENYKSSDLPDIQNCVSALEIIEYDNLYSNLIKHLLGNVCVYDTEDMPNTEGITLIHKSGKITKRSFSFSGGSVGLFEGKRIGRAKNLEKLSKEIKDLHSKQDQISNKLSDAQSELQNLTVADKSNELEEARDEINVINETYATVKTKQEQFHNLLSSNSLRKVDIQIQIEELTNDLEDLKPKHTKESEGLESFKEAIDAKREELEKFNELLSVKSQAFNEENVLFHRQQNKLNSITQEISYKEESYNSSIERIERNSEELSHAEKDLYELVKKSAENDDDLVGMYEEKETIELGVNEAEKEYYHTRGKIDEEEKNIREIQRQRETADHVLMQWQNQLNEIKMALNSVKDRLSVEFNIDFDQLTTEKNPDFENKSEQEIKSIVEKLKNRLDNMGPINPMAMEAYEEIKERYDFISGQKEDLIKAKESLLETIEEIDTVAKETFLDAFGKIKENFVKVFRTLFTDEDDCDVYLTDPENPLESSIDIIAKPKGKRPLTINQLSGGEKTLTATSLLFAIYLLKPAPFCIFDEVDAPLDDANIDKFNQIIREFSTDSQFIIVTHNKRTMASTDIIYGITMIEQGISKVVPVDLRELA